MKKILFLSDINSAHTQKWVMGTVAMEFEAGIFSLTPSEYDWYSNFGIRILNENFVVGKEIYGKGDLSKIRYFKTYRSLKKVIRSFGPDIIHAHYATSYGILGALSGFHPYILSVWGSDVFDFPNRSLFHRLLLKWNFKQADLLLSTSKIMKEEILKYSEKPVEITPFGIDTDVFCDFKTDDDVFTIGIIKTLEKHYGIDNLIKAFDIIVRKYRSKKLKLLIVGDGSGMNEYKNLATELKISDKVVFTGRILQEEVPSMHNRIDLFVCPSLSESFGVSVLEASACEVPVIVTNVGGLPEVVVNNQTGLILNSHDINELADAISYFIDNPDMITIFGKRGRKFVQDNYDWKNNLSQINHIYKRF